jgi:GNAT superfamily N-acetyltransferase
MFVRRASAEDVPSMARVFLAARHAMLHIVPMIHPDEDVPRWLRDVVLPACEITLAEVEGAVVALLVLRPGWVEQLYVHPDFQGRQIGARLLALAQASGHAAAGLELWTFQANAGARRFYERHGFKAAEFTDGEANEEKTPDVRYVWRPRAAQLSR